jgi:hypothetical protein
VKRLSIKNKDITSDLMFLYECVVLLEREREREIGERNHVWERETRFVRKVCKFIFIIYEDKNIFSTNLTCLVNHGEKLKIFKS